jgi:hypothetical protein
MTAPLTALLHTRATASPRRRCPRLGGGGGRGRRLHDLPGVSSACTRGPLSFYCAKIADNADLINQIP